MKRLALVSFILFGILGFFNIADARSGCCSHHGGVCGCGCCDGSSLSATCAPYYPSCNSVEPDLPVIVNREELVSPIERSNDVSVDSAVVQDDGSNTVVNNIAQTQASSGYVANIDNEQTEQTSPNNFGAEKQLDTITDNKSNTANQDGDESSNVIGWLFLIAASGVIGYKIKNRNRKD